MVALDGGHWKHLEGQAEYKDRLRRDQVSELWDIVIADLVKHTIGNTFVQGNANPAGMETILRRMAAEPRFNRRILSKAMLGIISVANVRARMIKAPQRDLVYVFMCIGIDEDREAVARELDARCTVAISIHRSGLSSLTAIGIATQNWDSRQQFTIAMMAGYPAWSPELQSQADRLQAAGFFKNIKATRFSESEYPDDGSASKSS